MALLASARFLGAPLTKKSIWEFFRIKNWCGTLFDANVAPGTPVGKEIRGRTPKVGAFKPAAAGVRSPAGKGSVMAGSRRLLRGFRGPPVVALGFSEGLGAYVDPRVWLYRRLAPSSGTRRSLMATWATCLTNDGPSSFLAVKPKRPPRRGAPSEARCVSTNARRRGSRGSLARGILQLPTRLEVNWAERGFGGCVWAVASTLRRRAACGLAMERGPRPRRRHAFREFRGREQSACRLPLLLGVEPERIPRRVVRGGLLPRVWRV